MGKLRVYYLKTHKKLSIYPLGKTPSAPSAKKCLYWMVLMPVYVETAEGLVKPLVILPAAIMPLPPFILIFSQRHCPFVLADSFFSHDPLHPRFTLQINPTLFIAFVPLTFPLSY